MASAQAAISIPPAPPNKWPVIDFVELIETLSAYSPKTLLDRAGFANIADVGGSSVRVDVIDLLR